MQLDLSGLQPAITKLLQSAPARLPLTLKNKPLPATLGLVQHDANTLFHAARDAAAALSGALLLAGYWTASHQTSQDNPSREGSYWHAIAHRLEPDTSNAGYWFRRVGQHPIYAELTDYAAQRLRESNLESWRLGPEWNPELFLAWCDEARNQPGSEYELVARDIAQAECILLFQWCL